MARHVTAADVVAQVCALVAAVPERTVYIGVDGFGAAGKTTLAERIAADCDRAQIVHVDDFAGPAVPEWDWDRFEVQLLSPLRNGAAARYQVWDWDTDSGGPWVDVAPGQVLVIEGVSATRREVRVDWDLTVWVNAPREVRLQRALDRDGPEKMATWLTSWIPTEEAYAVRELPQQRVDLIVDGVAPAVGVDLGQSGTL